MAALRLGTLCRAMMRPSITAAPLQRGFAMTAGCMRKEIMMPDPLEHSVGIEKYEKLAHLAGNDDPFEMKVFEQGEGTKDNPDLVPSVYNKRLLAHLCEDDQPFLQYMYIYKGQPKRCRCGHWFKLVEAEPLHIH